MFLIPFIIILPLTFPGGESIKVIGIPFRLGGLRLAILICIKAIAIVSTTYAIFGSARFSVSMIAIQRLRCPKVIIQMILFTYRYIFLFMDEMKRMDMAMRARGFVLKTDLNTLRILGNFLGTLLVRSFERTVRVYNAMLSKGYEGEFHTLDSFEANGKDFVKAALILVITLTLLASDIFGPFSPAIQRWF
jgi:cobalt/nickel transport system permease protein